MLAHTRNCDEIWHAGDIGNLEIADRLAAVTTLRAVYGNADGHLVRAAHPLEQEFTVEGLKVWMIHIGGYPGRYPAGIKQALQAKRPGLFICGHSHILKVVRDPQLGLLHMNPGAAGIQGFHTVRTMLRFTVHDGKAGDAAVIELGQKGKSAQSVG